MSYSAGEVIVWLPSVGMNPGPSALTRICDGPSSRASTRVSPTTPAFEVT
jgi:hypothetical protein